MLRTDFHFFNDARGAALPSSGWAWPFSCLTASTWPMVPFPDLEQIHNARIRWCYLSDHPNNGLRLVHFDNGPQNLQIIQTQMGEMDGQPRNHAVDVTSELQALQAGGVPKNLGYQFSVYGASRLVLYRASMEITWTTRPVTDD